VPALTHAGGHAWESIHCVGYLDEAFPARGAALLPRGDPLARAHARIWADFCTDRVQRTYHLVLMSQDEGKRNAVKAAFFSECRALAAAMAPVAAGPYFQGEEFCLVDVALAPFWQQIHWVGGHYRGLALPSNESDPAFARLEAWWAAVRARPSVAATLVCRERLVASYHEYAVNVGTSDFAQGMQSSCSKGLMVSAG
jgi:glutathione S-transferase